MTRTRKWLLGSVAVIGVVVLALLVVLVWMFYTSAGLRFALDRGVALTGGGFGYASASGSLAGRVTLTGLRYRDASGDRIDIARTALTLHPWALLGKRVHVSDARIDGIVVALAPTPAQKQPSGPTSLQPPITLQIDDARLTRIDVSQAGKPVFVADSLALTAYWSARRLAITQLDLHAPAGSASLKGRLALRRGYRGQGQAVFDWTQDGRRYTGELTSTSDGKTATLEATLTAPIKATLTANVALADQHAWTLQLDAPTFAASNLPGLPASIHRAALHLTGRGTAAGADVDGRLALNEHVVTLGPTHLAYDGKALALAPLRLGTPAAAGNATLTGEVDLAASPITAQLTADWRGVELPADLAGQALATHGTLRFEGSAARYALKGSLALGPPDRLANIDVDLTGTPQAIELATLKLVQKDGGLAAHGRIGLGTRTTWQLDAAATHLDPGAFFAGWNGALDFHLATQGTLTPQGPAARLQLDRAGGTLRGRSIAGSHADVHIAPGANLFDGTATLVAGSSRIELAGKPGVRTDATLKLAIASLGDWLPDASGSARGQIGVTGAWPTLAVTAQLQAHALRHGNQHVDTAQLDANIPNLAQPGGRLDFNAHGVAAGNLDFDAIRLTAGGTAATHTLQLTVRGKQLSLGLRLNGAWQAAQKRWSGTLSDIEVSPQGMPAWRQQQATRIDWRAGTATLSQLCLSAGAPQLCVSGKRDVSGAISASYTLQRLPLQLLASLAGGADPLEASGTVSGVGQLTLAADGTLGGKASLDATPGAIRYASHPDRPLLAWKQLGATATASGATQHVKVTGALDDGGNLVGDVTVSGAARAVQGSLHADLRSLAFLEALSPEIANVHGSLAGNLTLAGTLAAPQFQGGIQTTGFSAELPRAGLKLSDGQFAINGDASGALHISGHVTSGKGVLKFDGSTGLSAASPLALHISGDDVLVANIPAAHVEASPNLQLARNDGGYALTGTVAIPRAKVEVEKLPGQGPATASPDVVIVDARPAPPTTPMRLGATITVTLGDDVAVQGYGFDGKVAGHLVVQALPGKEATGRGDIQVGGTYKAYGQNLSIQRGRVLYAGTRLDNPGLDVRAVRDLRNQGVTVGLQIRGTAERPVLTVFSTPSMEQAEALSYLVTGRPLDALKSGEGDTLNTAAQALGGLAGDRLAKSIGSRLGVDAGVSSNDAIGGSAFTAGKYLSPRLYLSYGVGLFTPGQVITLRYTINRFLQFEAENATTGNRASLNYRIEK